MTARLEDFVADIQSYHYVRFPIADYRDCVIQHRHCYAAAVSQRRRMPLWVAYCVKLRNLLGQNVLSRNFHTELDFTIRSKAYAGSGYDQGHLCPLASYRADVSAAETNAMANIVPQTPELNRGAWLKLEEQVRKLSHEYGEVFVVSAPVWRFDEGELDGAAIPSHCAKVIYCAFQDPAVDCYLLPQTIERSANPMDYRTDLERVVELTGVRPFTTA